MVDRNSNFVALLPLLQASATGFTQSAIPTRLMVDRGWLIETAICDCRLPTATADCDYRLAIGDCAWTATDEH